MRYVGTRASETNPLGSIPLIRPAAAVMGHSDAFKSGLGVADRPLRRVRDRERHRLSLRSAGAGE